MRIVLPLPDKMLSPNGRPTRRQKIRLVKEARALAFAIAWQQRNGQPTIEVAEATETFYWPDAARRDVRNAEAAMKPYWDGIVDATLIRDDDYIHLTHLPTRFQIDRKRPRVEIEIVAHEKTRLPQGQAGFDSYGNFGVVLHHPRSHP